jgi:hypothetical protein
MEAVEELEEEACIMCCQVTHAKATFLLGTLSFFPVDKAFSTGGFVNARPQECLASTVHDLNDARRERHCLHCVGNQAIQYRVDKDQPALVVK